MKSTTRILIILVVVIIVAVAVYFGVRHGPEVAQTSPSPSASATESMAPLASATPIVVTYNAAGSDWKTYSSASAGFSVSYPSNWTAGACGEGCTGFAPATAAQGQFALGVIKHAGTMADLLAQAQQYLVKKEEVKVGTNTWTKLTLRQPTTGELVTSHFLVHGSDIFEFGTATSDADIIAIYGSMIRSFKFAK